MRTRDGIVTEEITAPTKAERMAMLGKTTSQGTQTTATSSGGSRNGFAPRNSRKNTALPSP